MLIKEVIKLSPLERLTYWISERESIRLKKEAGLSKPWTDDAILQSYRFCNVRRMDDSVSVWLRKTWYEPYFNHPNMVLAACLARFVNKPDSLEKVTKVVFAGKVTDKAVSWNAPLIGKILREYRDAGNTVFNGAYMVRGNDGSDKISSVLDYYIQSVVGKGIVVNRSSMEETWKELSDCYGFGSFMAGQVVADMRWAMKGTWEDRMTWAPIGPGSLKGMNIVMGRPLKQPIKQSVFLQELQDLADKLRQKLSHSITSRLELHDFQNTCCELSKYSRALLGEGKPKQLYNGRADN